MGTSTSYTAPTTSDWSRFKLSMTKFAVGSESAGRMLAAYIAAQGGTSAASTQATAIKRSAQRLGAFLSSASRDFGEALRERGLVSIVGEDFDTIIAALVDWIADSSSTPEAAVVRNSVADVLIDLFSEAEGDPTLFDAIAQDKITESLIQRMLLDLIKKWIFSDALRRGGSQLELRDISRGDLKLREDELREYLSEAVSFNFGEYSHINLLTADWNSPEIHQIVDDLVESSLEILGTQA